MTNPINTNNELNKIKTVNEEYEKGSLSEASPITNVVEKAFTSFTRPNINSDGSPNSFRKRTLDTNEERKSPLIPRTEPLSPSPNSPSAAKIRKVESPTIKRHCPPGDISSIKNMEGNDSELSGIYKKQEWNKKPEPQEFATRNRRPTSDIFKPYELRNAKDSFIQQEQALAYASEVAKDIQSFSIANLLRGRNSDEQLLLLPAEDTSNIFGDDEDSEMEEIAGKFPMGINSEHSRVSSNIFISSEERQRQERELEQLLQDTAQEDLDKHIESIQFLGNKAADSEDKTKKKQ